MSSSALKKIPVEQVRLGMHLHELCGAWLDHPFWKTKFVLHDAVDLEKLQRSGVRECWIDVSKGFDVACDAGEPARPAPKGQVAVAALDLDAATDLARAAQVAPLAQVPFNEELQRAADLCNQARAAVISLFSEARMGRVVFSEECEELVHGISDSVMRNSTTMVSLARLKSHDDYTYMHSVAVAALMAALARQLQLGTDEIRLAAKAGLLHDMGKAVMPRAILNKPGKLTDDEFTVIRTHPERGHALLLTDGAVHEAVLDVCLHHHEKIDGSGYPHRLPGADISMFAKMGAVCDVYDAITSNRPYKQGWDPAESIARMAGWAQGHFDPAIFKAFVTSLGIYPTGSLVRLKSGLLAVVTQQNAAALTCPEVKVFFSTKQGLHVPPRLLDLSDPKCADRIIGRESNDTWKFAHLDELWAGEDALRKIGRNR